MAKKSSVLRDEKRRALSKKYNALRLTLKEKIIALSVSDADRAAAERKLQTLPRDSSRCRQRNRCSQCGRSRGFNRLTGLCRIHMRYAVMNGLVPGMRKASW